MISVVIGSVVTGDVTLVFPFSGHVAVAHPLPLRPLILVLTYERRFDQASIATATTMIAPLTMSW
jgi:hypothetical protein